MDNEEIRGVKFSEFPPASPEGADEIVGLHNGDNARFSLTNIVLAIRQGLINIFVPVSRKVNNKALSEDITLTASDVGAVDTAYVGVADGVATLDSNGKVPGNQLDLSGKQSTITANGILKGDGAGGVTAATAGTDYQAPLTAGTDYATPGMIPTVPSISTAPPQMDGTGAAGSTGQVSDAGHTHPSDTSKANETELAYVETGSTASRAYAVGEYFCWNGLLYRVKTAIGSGLPFTVGTNCEAVTGGGLNDSLKMLTSHKYAGTGDSPVQHDQVQSASYTDVSATVFTETASVALRTFSFSFPSASSYRYASVRLNGNSVLNFGNQGSMGTPSYVSLPMILKKDDVVSVRTQTAGAGTTSFYAMVT